MQKHDYTHTNIHTFYKKGNSDSNLWRYTHTNNQVLLFPHRWASECVSVSVGTEADGVVNTLWNHSIQAHTHTQTQVDIVQKV